MRTRAQARGRDRSAPLFDRRRHGVRPPAAAALQRALGNRALAGLLRARGTRGPRVLQRAQVGRITTPARGTPHFVYELDAAIDNYPKLASHYGVSVGQIATENPDVVAGELRKGQAIQVPAFNPPPANSQPKEAGAARVVKGRAGTTVPVLWSRGGNKVGDIAAGRSVFVFPGGVDVPLASIANQAPGIVKEMEERKLIADGMMLFGHVDAASLLGPGETSDDPTGGWSRKLTDAPRLMDGSKPSYQVMFDHILPAVPQGATQLWQVVESKQVLLNDKCEVTTETAHVIDVVDIGGRAAINDSWGWIRRDDPCFALEVSHATVGFDDQKSGYAQQSSVKASAALAKKTLDKMAGPKATYSGVYTFVKGANCKACATKLKELQEANNAPDGEALAVDGVGKWP